MTLRRRALPTFAAGLALGVAAAIGVAAAPTSQAATLSVGGVTLSWDESTMYYPSGCSRFSFSYANDSSTEYLRVGFDLLSKFGDSITFDSVIPLEAGVRGTFSPLICNFEVEDFGLGPYTMVLSVKQYNGQTAEASAPFSFVTRPRPPSPPGFPLGAEAVAGDRQATVTWKAPIWEGTAPITSYTVTALPGSHTCTAPPTQLTCVVEGLTNGVSYTFTVTAANSVGVSSESLATRPVTPSAVPTKPRNVVGRPGDARVAVSWTQPEDTGGTPVSRYTVTASPGGKTCQTARLTCTVLGLEPGSEYTFTVTATNAAGTSPASDPSPAVKPLLVIKRPGPVTKLRHSKQVGALELSWAAPRDLGGAPAVEYEYSVDFGPWIATKSTRIVVRGTTGKLIYVKVRAVNGAGPGPFNYVLARPA